MKKFLSMVVVTVGLVSNLLAKDIIYDASYSSKYALEQVLNVGSDDQSKWNYWFKDWTFGSFGNCTNFVNQSIRAGLKKTTSPGTIYKSNNEFNDDSSWYYTHYNQSYAWKGANEFYQYVNNMLNGCNTGINFIFRTKDTPYESLDFTKIKIGDIIFVDWTNDGSIDHTMIVTSGSITKYSNTFVSYQSSANTTPKKNISLETLNIAFKSNCIFHVYRPTTYKN